MPTYLCHGFRWQRPSILKFIFMNDLDDAALNWVIEPTSATAIIDQFILNYDFVPDEDDSVAQDAPAHLLAPVKLLEEYNPNDTTVASSPHVYVADHVLRVDLAANVAHETDLYDQAHKGDKDRWIDRLKNELQEDAEVRWYIVVCGDEERGYPGQYSDEDDEDDDGAEEEEEDRLTPTSSRQLPIRQRMDGD